MKNQFFRKKISIYFMLAICFGCSMTQEKEVIGLWQLDNVHFMHFERKFEQAILSIHENGTFAVSQAENDFVGLYKINGDTLEFISTDETWFNEPWSLGISNGEMFLEGIGKNLSETSLTFKQLDQIPDLNIVEEKLIGSWDLYKIRGNGRSDKNLSNTLLHISDDGQYIIHDEFGLLEQGKMYINSRHRNIVFENNNIIWDVLLLNDELRLTDEQTGLQYCLREVR
ncbi:MAG: hypothetical protein RLO17_02745 [Cyclobacteriaceae bacterium]